MLQAAGQDRLLGSKRSSSSHVGVHEDALTNEPSVSWNQTMLWRFIGPRKTTETPSSKGAKGPLTDSSCRSRGQRVGRKYVEWRLLRGGTDGKFSRPLTRRTFENWCTYYQVEFGRTHVTGARLFVEMLLDRRDRRDNLLCTPLSRHRLSAISLVAAL